MLQPEKPEKLEMLIILIHKPTEENCFYMWKDYKHLRNERVLIPVAHSIEIDDQAAEGRKMLEI